MLHLRTPPCELQTAPRAHCFLGRLLPKTSAVPSRAPPFFGPRTLAQSNSRPLRYIPRPEILTLAETVSSAAEIAFPSLADTDPTSHRSLINAPR